jgi:hypothetical protein
MQFSAIVMSACSQTPSVYVFVQGETPVCVGLIEEKELPWITALNSGWDAATCQHGSIINYQVHVFPIVGVFAAAGKLKLHLARWMLLTYSSSALLGGIRKSRSLRDNARPSSWEQWRIKIQEPFLILKLIQPVTTEHVCLTGWFKVNCHNTKQRIEFRT